MVYRRHGWKANQIQTLSTYLDEENVCASLGQGQRNGLTNASSTSGDQSRVVLQAEEAHDVMGALSKHN
jgi:hypothetical protein